MLTPREFLKIFPFHLWIILKQLRALFVTGADKTLLVKQFALLSSLLCHWHQLLHLKK
jgi:hypothetical protein